MKMESRPLRFEAQLRLSPEANCLDGNGTIDGLIRGLLRSGQTRQRDLYSKPRIRIFSRDRALMQLNGTHCDREPKPDPTAIGISSVLYAEERLKNLREQLFEDAG